MKCRVPVIGSKYSSIPEVVGDGVILVPTDNYLSIKESMEKVIYNDDLRNDLIKKGLKQAGKFSYMKCANETLEIYENVYN